MEFQLEARGHLALFAVRDRGIGMPEADARLLFPAFHRGRMRKFRVFFRRRLDKVKDAALRVQRDD